MQNYIPNFENATGIFFFVLGIIIFLWIFFGETPESESKPKDDPPKARQRELAILMLKGDKTPEQIQADEGFDIEHIKQWKLDYIEEAEKDRKLRNSLGID